MLFGGETAMNNDERIKAGKAKATPAAEAAQSRTKNHISDMIINRNIKEKQKGRITVACFHPMNEMAEGMQAK